jgi:hypothetical protein
MGFGSLTGDARLATANPNASCDGSSPIASIAKESGFDAGKVALLLLDPHPKMPTWNYPAPTTSPPIYIATVR